MEIGINSKMKFSKYQGTGNDFIVITDSGCHLHSSQIRRLCDRRYGIGGDGLILIKQSDETDACIEIFNADGNSADMCGNGLRCVVQYLLDHGLEKKGFTLTVGDKSYSATVDEGEIVIDMGVPKILEEGTMSELPYYHIDSGVPHFVHFCDELNRDDFIQIAQDLRHHQHFSPSGVNVNFVKLLPSCLLQVRTYERGVEDETLSCGTGATAACVAAWRKYGIKGKIEVEFCSRERLRFDLLATDSLLHGIYMRGHAMHVFEGELEL